jgi:hypothetical protein
VFKSAVVVVAAVFFFLAQQFCSRATAALSVYYVQRSTSFLFNEPVRTRLDWHDVARTKTTRSKVQKRILDCI